MSDFGALLGTALKAAAAAALTTNAPVQDVNSNKNVMSIEKERTVTVVAQPYSTGDIPLNSIKKFPLDSTFQNYLNESNDNMDDVTPQTYKDFLPTINSYYTVDQERVKIQSLSSGELHDYYLRDGYGSGIGYKNKEQMFCYTLTSVIVEDFHFHREVSKKSITDILNTIMTGFGVFSFTGSSYESGVGRVMYIDEFGGPLASNIKKTYLTYLLSKGQEALEAMRFATKKDAVELYTECYKSVGGDSQYNPLYLVSKKEDFLFNSVPEVRDYFAKIKAAQGLEDARNQARMARDNKVRAEREAEIKKEQEREQARVQAEQEKIQAERNRQQALEALRIEKQNKEAAIAAQAEAEEMSRKQKEINRLKALESLGK